MQRIPLWRRRRGSEIGTWRGSRIRGQSCVRVRWNWRLNSLPRTVATAAGQWSPHRTSIPATLRRGYRSFRRRRGGRSRRCRKPTWGALPVVPPSLCSHVELAGRLPEPDRRCRRRSNFAESEREREGVWLLNERDGVVLVSGLCVCLFHYKYRCFCPFFSNNNKY